MHQDFASFVKAGGNNESHFSLAWGFCILPRVSYGAFGFKWFLLIYQRAPYRYLRPGVAWFDLNSLGSQRQSQLAFVVGRIPVCGAGKHEQISRISLKRFFKFAFCFVGPTELEQRKNPSCAAALVICRWLVVGDRAQGLFRSAKSAVEIARLRRAPFCVRIKLERPFISHRLIEASEMCMPGPELDGRQPDREQAGPLLSLSEWPRSPARCQHKPATASSRFGSPPNLPQWLGAFADAATHLAVRFTESSDHTPETLLRSTDGASAIACISFSIPPELSPFFNLSSPRAA